MKAVWLGIFSLLLVLGLSSPARAQIPVTDGGSLAQQISAHLETLARWKSQLDLALSTAESMKRQYDSITGIRNLGDVFNNPYLRSYLPPEWQKVYDQTKALGYGGLSGSGARAYAEYRAFDACAKFKAKDERTTCEARAVKAAIDKGYAFDAFLLASKRIFQIDKLMAAINGTKDPKEIAELQGRIGAEQAMIGAEQTKLELYKSVAAAEDAALEQRARELEARTWAKREFVEVAPLTF
jgi:type IV secretion system protein VirB5